MLNFCMMFYFFEMHIYSLSLTVQNLECWCVGVNVCLLYMCSHETAYWLYTPSATYLPAGPSCPHTHSFHPHEHTQNHFNKSHCLLIMREPVQPALFIMNGIYLSGVISTNEYGKTFRQHRPFKIFGLHGSLDVGLAFQQFSLFTIFGNIN